MNFQGDGAMYLSLKDIFERDGRNGKKKSNPEPLGNDMTFLSKPLSESVGTHTLH